MARTLLQVLSPSWLREDDERGDGRGRRGSRDFGSGTLGATLEHDEAEGGGEAGAVEHGARDTARGAPWAEVVEGWRADGGGGGQGRARGGGADGEPMAEEEGRGGLEKAGQMGRDTTPPTLLQARLSES